MGFIWQSTWGQLAGSYEKRQKIRVAKTAGNFLTNSESITVSRRTLLCTEKKHNISNTGI